MNELTLCASCRTEHSPDPAQIEMGYDKWCDPCALEAAFAEALEVILNGRLSFWSDPNWPLRIRTLVEAVEFIAFASGSTLTETTEILRERLLDRL